VSDLDSSPIIDRDRNLRELGPTFYSSLYQFCSKAGFSPNVAMEVSQINAAVGLVGSGIGVALVPESMNQLRFDNVVYRPLVERAPNVDVLLAWQAGRPSELLQSFIDMSKQFVRAGARTNSVILVPD